VVACPPVWTPKYGIFVDGIESVQENFLLFALLIYVYTLAEGYYDFS